MTQEEAIFKMLEQVLKNQKVILSALYVEYGNFRPELEDRIVETKALLEKIHE